VQERTLLVAPKPDYIIGRHPIPRIPMRRLLLALLCMLGPITTLGAQASIAQGERVRVRLDGGSGQWLRAEGLAPTADSSTLLLTGTRVELRAPHGLLPMERAQGKHWGRGIGIGALIGAVALATPFVLEIRGRDPGLGGLLVPVLALTGGAAGGLLGAMMAPTRWVPVGAATDGCGAWRLVPGSEVSLRRDAATHRGWVVRHDNDAVVLRLEAASAPDIRIPTDGATLAVVGSRNRTKGALTGAAAGALLGVVGISLDNNAATEDVLPTLLGNAIVGAGVGALVGPRQSLRHPLLCR